jgi:hypothetical protein
MTGSLQASVDLERARHREARQAGDDASAWRALERAHVLSQAVLSLHIAVHADMFRYAIARREWHEAAGQLLRLALAPIGHVSGRTPAGNIGRARVSAFVEMPILDDLARMMKPVTDRADPGLQGRG